MTTRRRNPTGRIESPTVPPPTCRILPSVSRIYLTTPIYYVTAKPHLGHAYTTIVGDALARWHRLLGDDVHFLTGTDEHGQKVQDYADTAGKDPQTFVDEIAPLYAEAWERLGITHDDFIRTTEQRHKIGVAELLQRCYDAGDIELDVYKGKYCVACEEYYTDDELDEGDLCKIHRRKVEYYEEENYFFRLSRFQQRLLDWYDAHPGAIKPEFRGNEALGLIRGGLRDFSVSRTSLKWGIPLPWDSKHVAYVWFDALANYITAIGYGTDQAAFESRWPAVHLIGKDIIRHHCVYWPAMLMSAGIEPPAGWAVGGWLLVGGEKMSKTQGNVVNPLELIDEIGLDGFRYYVLAETPYGQDGDFTYEGLVGRYNSDLANNLGNLAARVATVVGKKCDGVGPAPAADSPLAAVAAQAYADTARSWGDMQPSRALEATWTLIRATNAHLEANEPWKAEPGPGVDAVMGDALEALRIVSILASPAVPGSAQAVWERIGMPGQVTDQRLPQAAAWGGYPGGLPVVKGDPLFPRR
jgi:methionyl-tRNA synthetase